MNNHSIKKLTFEIVLILVLALFSALTFNQLSGNNISIFKKYEMEKPDHKNYNIETINIEILKYYLAKKSSIILDARTPEDFAEKHIPGANNFSVGNFDSLFRERGDLLKLGEVIIVYCSGPSCEDSRNLAEKLSDRGFENIFVFKGGMEEWEKVEGKIIGENK